MIKKDVELKSWEALIKDYIDQLEDQDKSDDYLGELVSRFCYEKCIAGATNNQSEHKQLTNEFKNIEKTKLTAKNKNKLKEYYQLFSSNGWIENYDSALARLESKKCFYNIWICRALSLGYGVHPATHIAKLTHSSSGGLSILDNDQSINYKYITTSSLKNKPIDGAYPNAAVSKIVKFLMLKNNNIMLSEELKNGNSEAIKIFASDEEELTDWMRAFKSNLTPSIKTDSLAKQVYFPVSNDYHLLSAMKSSSLAQSLFLNNFEKTFRKDQEKIDRARSKNRYSTQIYKKSVNVAKISTTLSQPQNVSVLNGARGGKFHLFSCAPPDWQSQLKPPIQSISFLYSVHLQKSTRTTLDYLRDFLIRHQRLGLSIKDPKNLKWLDKWTDEIIDEVLGYAANIQNLQPGWSSADDIKLKLEHQYFLDPYRDDDVFQTARKAGDWHTVICKDFAQWLNRLLIGKDKQFTPQREHRRLWMAFMDQPLRDYIQTIEQNFKAQAREQS